MKARDTLTNKLIGQQILLLAVLLVVIGVSQFLILREVLLESTARSLRQETMVLAPLIHRTMLHSHPGTFTKVAHFLLNRLQEPDVGVIITNYNGQIIAHSQNLPPVLPPQLYGPDYSLWHGFLVVWAPLGSPFDPTGYVWLLAHTAPLWTILRRDTELYILLALAVLVAAGWLGAWLVRQTLTPLSEIRRSTIRISRGDFGHTEDWSRGPKELAELGDAINAMSLAIHDLFQHEKQLAEQMRRFLADASHELRTPLTALTGFLSLMDQGRLTPEEMQRGIHAMVRESQRMSRLVNQLLTLSRIDSSPDAHIHVTTLALADWLTDLKPTLVGLVVPRPLRLELDPVNVLADPDRMTEILLNILENASRYSPPDAPIAVRVAPDGAWGLLEVEDNGPGIPPDAIPHIFERFYRTDAARIAASGGTGLGLSIVDALVKAQHGTVEATNQRAPRHGAIVRVRLPRAPGLSSANL